MNELRKSAEMALDYIRREGWTNSQGKEVFIALQEALAQPEPTVEDNSQQWKGMDGAVAWHLIDRHADNWADVGKMMDEWLKANQALVQHVDAVNMSQECVDETAKHEHDPEWIEDGFGTMWQKCGKKDCGKFVVKIGKVDCWNGDCPESKENT